MKKTGKQGKEDFMKKYTSVSW